jgi:lysophospholipase L1-like esterase
MNPNIETLVKRISTDRPTRILGFGSSNTERLYHGMHWFDCFELSLHQQFGAMAHCINTGVGGSTTRDLLKRFDTDAAFYKPHAVFITIGGNDSKPEAGISDTEFESNLHELWKRFDQMGTHVIFQTYYAIQSQDTPRYQAFYRYMDIVRKVAAHTNASLIDHLARWEPLRLKRNEIYMPLMHDEFHLNCRGNCVMGLDIVRAFGWKMAPQLDFWGEAILIQGIMDQLSSNGS